MLILNKIVNFNIQTNFMKINGHGHILPEPDISIELSHESFGRHIHLMSHTSLGAECLKAII